MSPPPPGAIRQSLELHKRAKATAAGGLPAIAMELREIEATMNGSTTVEYPLRVLMLAVAMLAEQAAR